ncbi:MAG: cell division protein FtsA [Verrucomicrobia bacterium]|nr:MAG: cell division protein FtsA [Verrucomicrobiota bacterium]
MFKPSHHIIVGLELGTSKICVVVGALSHEGVLNIIAVGQHKSRGVRKGEIVDHDLASEDVREALRQAEEMAELRIRSVYLGVTGAHIKGFTNRGRHHLPPPERQVTEADIEDVGHNACALGLPAEREVLHVFRQHYVLDGRGGILNPIGLTGEVLELDVHVIHGHSERLKTPINLVRQAQIDIEEVVFNGIGSSLAVLTPQQKDLGALVIDLGAGATEYVVYAGRVVRHSGVLAVGGDHVTNDLAYGLRLSQSHAEQLKVEHGAALMAPEVRGRTLALQANGLESDTVSLENLHRIMSLRLRETLDIIAEDVDRTGLLSFLRAGVVLCGGGARIPGICQLAQEVFGLPATVATCRDLGGQAASLDQPEFATGIGLVRFGATRVGQRRSAGLMARLASKVGGLLNKTAKP